MHRKAKLVNPDGADKEVDLHDIASNPWLAPLMTTEGPLTYLRQKNVPVHNPIDIYNPKPKPLIDGIDPGLFEEWKEFKF